MAKKVESHELFMTTVPFCAKSLYLAFHFAFFRSLLRLSKADLNGLPTTAAHAHGSWFVCTQLGFTSPLQELSKAGKEEASSTPKWKKPHSSLFQICVPKWIRERIKKASCTRLFSVLKHR